MNRTSGHERMPLVPVGASEGRGHVMEEMT
jgi:hypothetical protein